MQISSSLRDFGTNTTTFITNTCSTAYSKTIKFIKNANDYANHNPAKVAALFKCSLEIITLTALVIAVAAGAVVDSMLLVITGIVLSIFAYNLSKAFAKIENMALHAKKKNMGSDFLLNNRYKTTFASVLLKTIMVQTVASLFNQALTAIRILAVSVSFIAFLIGHIPTVALSLGVAYLAYDTSRGFKKIDRWIHNDVENKISSKSFILTAIKESFKNETFVIGLVFRMIHTLRNQ
jgi:hypothetical protein